MESKTVIYPSTERSISELKKKNMSKIKNILAILIPIIVLILIGIIVGLVFLLKHKKGDGNDKKKEPDKIDETNQIEKEPETNLKYKKLEQEFEIATTTGELSRIYVTQKSVDETKIKGKSFTINGIRKTNYDIYIMSEEEANEENQLFYSKLYTAAISIVSECYNMDSDNCELEKMVDLTEGRNINNKNVRLLNSPQDYKDLPIPLCIFKITNNNFITSISCPESFPDSKKNEIILDLYFFRPPAIERADKKNNNITVIKEEDKEKNRKYIREKNEGLCNVYDNFDSICTTEMNTTTDLENKLLQYDELAITNITNDENNYYIKKKYTHLIDESDKTKNLDPVNYKNSLDKLLQNLEPYMKEDIQFKTEDFIDLYNIVHKTTKISKNKQKYRSLLEYSIAQSQENEANIFNYIDSGGININYDLVNEPGLNGDESLKMFSNLKCDDKKKELVFLSHYTNISYIIDKLSVLSKAGKNISTELFNNLKDKLNNITNDISINFNDLIILIKYYDLSEIFDSTLSLSSLKILNKRIVDEIDYLVNELNDFYNKIKIGNLRDYANNLNLIIHNYIIQSHYLVKNIFDNMKELGNILKSVNNKLTEITTYYLNYTSSSYVYIIQDAQNILENYYTKEKNKILSKINEMLEGFEISTYNALEEEKKKINLLYNNLKNKTITIESGTNDDYDKLLLNLNITNKYVSDIIMRVKEFVNEELGLKDNGYFITDNELKINNNSYSNAIIESLEISRKLDNDEMIDKIFDEIMSNFRQNYTNIIKYMDQEKSLNFVLDENTLKDTLFTNLDKENIENEMENFRTEIVNKINKENNYYLTNIRTNISKFIDEDLGKLNSIISDLDIIYFSEDSLKSLSKSFEIAFNSISNKVMNDIKDNESLSKKYFDSLYNVINDNNYLLNLLKSYKTNEIPSKKKFGITTRTFKKFVDSITSKHKTNAYLSKYSEYIANFDYSKNYIKEQLYLEIKNVYKQILSSIREILQSIRNHKIVDKFPDFEELKFYNSHEKKIDELFDRLNKYFSDNIFNNKYIPLLNNNKKGYNEYIDSVKKYINIKHNSINGLPLEQDNINDFCIAYKRKICYGCTNCAWHTYVNDKYCLPLPSSVKDNHLSLLKSEIKSDKNLKEFQTNFKNFFSKLSEKINFYNSKIIELENTLNSVKIDTLDKKITQNYLKPFGDWVNSIISEKYGDTIIKASYNHYKKIIEERIGNILNNVSAKWNESFDYVSSEVEKNYDNFKGTTYEFGIMGQAYETLITTNITRNYFESIELFQKNEFNYTISYYYNYFIKIVNKAYQYIINSVPINKNGFNDILNERKNEINNNFNLFIKNINNSYNDSISIKKQKYVLLISEDDFFNIGNILSNNIIKTSNSLKNKYSELYDFEKIGDKYSVVSSFYLENSENGKQMEQLYSSVGDNSFVDLNLYKYKDLILENWAFDKKDFISKLNESLLNSTKEIEKDLIFQNETHSETLEREIIKILKNDSIENKISDFYLSEIKELETSHVNNIKKYINNIINIVKEKLKSEANTLKDTSTSYTKDYSKIENSLKEYKIDIFKKINSTIFGILDGFYENMIKNVYKNYIEIGLNDYIKEVKKETSTNDNCKDYLLLNSTYKIGIIIDDLLEDIVNKYKDKTKKTIDYKYEQYYLKIKNLINIDEINNLINSEIDTTYNSSLLPALKKYAIYNQGNQYTEYDFNENIKKEINSTINQNIQNIKNIISLTKGNNYNVDVYLNSWEIMSFSKVTYNIIRPMCKSFYNFFSSEETEQNSEVNEFIRKRIVSNFDNLLNNIIPTFGNQFFERIIKYNANFKISALYDNLKFSLTETLLYYISLDLCSDVDALPKDLIIRLFNLNNLDSTVSSKNKQILEVVEKKVSEFITESRISIMDRYYSYLQNDAEISNSFSETVLKKINDSLVTTMPEMGKNYKTMIEKYLKEKLITSYTKIMQEKTNEMIQFVQEKKEVLKSKLADLFSLDSDQVLINVNQKINNTKEAIRAYNEFFDSFEIPNRTIEFLNKYGNEYIKPIFSNMKTELNKASKNIIIDNLEKNSKNIENLNAEEFNLLINNYHSFFNDNYFTKFSNDINNYGTNNYSDHLNQQRNVKENRLRRRLGGDLEENDMLEDSQERIIDQGIEENFEKIFNSLNFVKINFDSLDAFKELDKKINNNIQKITDKYKESKKLIEENDYEEDVKNYLIEKLQNLANISKNYYNRINESYYQLRNYLNQSIEEVYNKIKNCSNITYKVFNEEFEKIVNNTQSFYLPISNSLDKLEELDEPFKITSEHKTNYVNASMTDMKERGEFKCDIIYKEENIKKLIIKANIINRSRPNKANIDIISPFSYCGKVVNNLDIQFNEANYTMDIYYDSETNKINITTYTFVEDYIYYLEIYKINGTSSKQAADTGDNEMSIPVKCKNTISQVLIPKYGISYNGTNENSSNIINA